MEKKVTLSIKMDIYQSDVNAMIVGAMKVPFIRFFYILSSKLNFKISFLLGAPGLQSPYLPITVGPLEVEIVISFLPSEFLFWNFQTNCRIAKQDKYLNKPILNVAYRTSNIKY